MKAFGIVMIGVLLVLALCIAPLFALWGINTLAEQAGSAFYIPHNWHTYLAILALAAVFAGTSRSSRS